MKKAIIFTIFIILTFPNKLQAQVCGGGILTFTIFTPNGSKSIDFEYEIFPVLEEQLQEKILDVMKKQNSLDGYLRKYNHSGIEISKQNADEIIAIDNENLNIQLNKFLANSGLNKFGKLKNKLEFKTFELVGFPVVLKISAQGKSVYILGNFFGNCDRPSSLIWSDKLTGVY